MKKEYVCGNCQKKFDPDEDIGEKITDKNWHFEPGSVVPYGVCDCGGYIHEQEATNAVIQSQTGAHFLEGLLKLLSEEQRQELEVTGCVTVGFGRQDPTKRFIERQLREAKEFPELMRKVAADFDTMLAVKAMPKDSPNTQTVPEFKPNFEITKEQLEMAAKAAPSLTELLEKQITTAALEEYGRFMNNLIGQQRRDWKTKTFAARYGRPMSWTFADRKKENP